MGKTKLNIEISDETYDEIKKQIESLKKMSPLISDDITVEKYIVSLLDSMVKFNSLSSNITNNNINNLFDNINMPNIFNGDDFSGIFNIFNKNNNSPDKKENQQGENKDINKKIKN